MNSLIQRIFPFLRWFPMSGATLRADFIAGITVALVIIPQSMAYAQLAGLPAFYGLYAAFLPVAVAAMWGSSHQLGTGPVAVVSLLTASSLSMFAAPGTAQFIALAIMLALMVGLVQLSLGVFKLGVIVNFLSHPVIVGFTNAAAIIIALSQVSKIFGVPMGRSEHFIVDIWGVVKQIGDTHYPTFLIGVLAIAIMWAVRRYKPSMPGVLIAVAVTTTISYFTHFSANSSASLDRVADNQVVALVNDYRATETRLETLNKQLLDKRNELKRLKEAENPDQSQALAVNYALEQLRIEIQSQEEINKSRAKQIRKQQFVREVDANNETVRLHLAGNVPPAATTDGIQWKFSGFDQDSLKLSSGGEVVGTIKPGLPPFSMPVIDLGVFGSLLSAALVISLVGFMEAISIAKAISAKTKQRVDPNQELIGQGLSNIVGSISNAFPVSGSFSRSAVNMNAGAITGMSSVFTAVFVLLTLLFLTPLLYHLPQSVLAAIVIMAVIGLINFQAIKHAWHAHKHDGAAAVVTFVATLAFAPHLDNGIMFGAGLAIVLFLLRTMKPRVAILGRCKDGTLRDIRVRPDLATSKHVVAMRLDGSLYFANVAYFEDTLLEAVAGHPDAKFVLVVSDGINQLDASGEEVIHHLVERLGKNGVTLVFSGLKKQVLDIMHKTGLYDVIGAANIFATEDHALADIYSRMGIEHDEMLPSSI